MALETAGKILERLLSNVSDLYDKKVGSFMHDIQYPVAKEFEDFYDTVETKQSQCYIATATGEFLDRKIEEFGKERNKAAFSSGTVTLTGNVGTSVKMGDKVASKSIIYSIGDNKTIGDHGEVDVKIICDTVGIHGNVGIGDVNRFPVTLSGVTSVTNKEPITGGSDEETDEEFKKRFMQYIEHPVTSGNKWEYESIAKDVNGVGDAKCKPLWNGKGTVKVIIVDAEKQTANSELIAKVKSEIDKNCPVGADVTVDTAETKVIDVGCEVIANGDVLDSIKTSISDYLKGVSFSKRYVSYARIGEAILSVENVEDYANLTINGGTKNIEIDDTEIAVLGGVTLV